MKELSKVISLKELVLDHTQFKFYAAFLPPDKRKEALNYAVSNNKCFGRKIPVPAQKPITYLKYCPICVKEEREKYGECYFHVEQNIPYVDVCHQHKCKLINTSVINVKSNNEMFWPLDLLVNSLDVEYEENNKKVEIAKYIKDILDCDYRLDNEITISRFLKTIISKKSISIIVKEINKFYEDLDYRISRDRLELVLYENSYNSFDIVFIAYFFKIKSCDLYYRRVYELDSLLDINKRVVQLYNRDYMHKDISKRLLISKMNEIRILKKEINNYNGVAKRTKRSIEYWAELDNVYSSDFINIIGRLNNQKINKRNVATLLNLKDWKLRKLPKLRYKINEYNKEVSNG